MNQPNAPKYYARPKQVVTFNFDTVMRPDQIVMGKMYQVSELRRNNDYCVFRASNADGWYDSRLFDFIFNGKKIDWRQIDIPKGLTDIPKGGRPR